MNDLKPGDTAPDFTLLDQNGEEVSLSDFAGRKVLLYFYPRASTPGCTQQACSIRDAMPDLSKLGIAALGISPDEPKRQLRFAEKQELNFKLLCDTETTTAQAYGVWREKMLFGKTGLGIIRSSFLIDETGRIIEAWYKVKPKDTVPNALAALES